MTLSIIPHERARLAGSVDPNDDSRFGHVDMVTAIRFGSVLKPFVYGLALDDGF